MTSASSSAASPAETAGEAVSPYVALHLKDRSYGRTGDRLAPYVRLLIRDSGAKSLIDYGCGKSNLAGRFSREGITRAERYDPYIAEISRRPEGRFDLLLNTDVLEHVPEAELDAVLADIRSFSDKAFLVISTIAADKILDTGENAHCTIHGADWWRERLKRHYPVVTHIPTAQDDACSFVTWEPKPETLKKLRETKSSIKLLGKIKRLFGIPLDLARLAINGFVPEKALLEALKNKRVALVGNSVALKETDCGAEIDAADIVIRLNKAPIISYRSHGSRTDWIATGVPISSPFVKERKVRYVLWMTKLRRMPRWMFKRRFVFLYPRTRAEALEQRIGKRASTGFMVIDLLERSQCSSVRLYGFDFFAALSESGHRTAAEVPHDFVKERELVEELAARDNRFVLRR